MTSESISAKGSDLAVGDFKIYAVIDDINGAGTTDDKVALTNTSGETYVVVGGKVTAATSNDKVATIKVSLKIEYTPSEGEAARTASELSSLWDATIGSKTITINASAGEDTLVRFVDGATPSSWADAAANKTFDVANEKLTGLSWTAAVVTPPTKAYALVANANVGNFYIAVSPKYDASATAGDAATSSDTASDHAHTITVTPEDPDA